MTQSTYLTQTPKVSAMRFLRGASAIVLASAMMTSVSYAQDVVTEEDEVVATGIRQSLENAQAIKRNADTFVDSITASDIGALPDRSVLEAIQRVPGVSISRFAAGDDPDHFSVEGSGVVIRGLSYVRSEFNGRDAFSANSGRSLGFQDVPPELVGGVDVFKNQTADMIEGGISGVVNLRTLKPFDRSERTIAATIEGTYTDLAEEFSPSISGLYSDRWDTKIGEVGLLASGSFSNLKSRSDGVQVGGLYPFLNTFDGPGGEDASANILAPTGVNVRTQDFDRDRTGLSLAGQWESNDGRSLATAEFIRSESKNAWTEHALQTEDSPNERASFFGVGDFTTSPLSGNPTVCANRDDCGTQVGGSALFQSGTISADTIGWIGYDPFLDAYTDGIRLQSNARASETKAVTSDYSLNYKFTPNDNLKFNFDAQYIHSTTKNSDIFSQNAQYANQIIDLNGAELNQDGYEEPTVQYVLLDNNPYVVDGSVDAATGLADPRNSYIRALMEHFEDSKGDEIALRGDVQYDFNNDSFFKSVRAGYRFAERDQLTRWTNYNWGNISEVWAGGPGFVSNNPELFETYSFENMHRGGVLNGNNTFNFVRTDLLQDYRALLDGFQGTDAYPAAENHLRGFGGRNADGSVNYVELRDRFLPSEITDAVETTHAFYARVDFGADEVKSLGGVSLDGNYGVRIIETKLSTQGAAQFQTNSQCVPDPFDPENPAPTVVLTEASAAACAALNTPATDITAEVDRVDILPSFNLKVGLSDDLILRFAAARGMSRPDVGSLRAFRNTSGEFTQGDVTNPEAAIEDQTRPLIFERYNVQGGNPGLEPVLSTNFDASLEWYFSDVGSLTVSGFYKNLDNIIVSADAPGANIGGPVLAGANYNGPLNAGDGKLKGFEVAYQQFYDFLPGALSGFGMQANYTYVDQDSIPQSDISSVRSNGVQDVTDNFTPGDLENLSKHTFNIVGLYENDKIEGRLAYNWRSDFLLTTLDVISSLPIYNESTGQLDASLKYQVTPQFQLGVQGVNLTSAVTETTSQINPEGDRFLRSRFENDRRVSLIGSFTF